MLTWPVIGGEALIDQAMDDTTVEREVKLAVPDLSPITARLTALDAADDTAHLQTVHEHNYILDTPQGDLKARDERLRMRHIVGRPGVIVTWKGPARVRNGVRRRPQREGPAADANACTAIFAPLGFHPVRSYEKLRSSWQLGGLIVCLHQLPVGDFVRLEVTDPVS